MRRMMERACGVEYLEGWVDQGPGAFPGLTARTRAFGARCVHVIAGNAPIVSILTVIRNALTRSDAIIKLPSNDPLTTVALVRNMVEMAPDHPRSEEQTSELQSLMRISNAVYCLRKNQ